MTDEREYTLATSEGVVLAQVSHDDAFAELRARKSAEAEATIKVTWRKVSALTGGGWSGLGPNGALVYVRLATDPWEGQSHYIYGRVVDQNRYMVGTRPTIPEAKRAAASLFTTNGRSTMTTATLPTPESLMEGIGDIVRPDKAPYARLRVNGKTIAYASTRKDGVVLDFPTALVEDVPKKFVGYLTTKGARATMHVTGQYEKIARDLLAWVAKPLA